MALEALIFDVDGTLAETEETHRRALNETFAAFGLNWVWDQTTYRGLLRIMGGKERLLHYIEFEDPDDAQKALDVLPALHAAKNKRYAELVAEGAVTLRPGVERLIHQARAAEIRLAIATTTSQNNVETLLRATIGPDAPALFETIAAGDAVAAKKPAPDIFALAIERLGIQPNEAVAIEDTVYGLRSATAAGVKTLITPSFYTDDQNFRGAAAVFDSLGDPDRPARHISGAGGSDTIVTVELLRSLVA